eukprot:Rmarinus@m.20015
MIEGFKKLEHLTAGNFVQGKQSLITISADATVAQALELFQASKLHALPVEKEENGEKNFIGILNLLDVMTGLAFLPHYVAHSSQEAQENLQVLVDNKFLSSSVEDCLGLSEESKRVWSFPSSEPVERIFDILCKGVHYCVITDEASKEMRMLSQTDILKYIAAHSGDLGCVLDKTVAELNLGKHQLNLTAKDSQKKAEIIPHTSSAMKGFQVMYKFQITGVGVVDEHGKLVGNLSASDVRGLKLDMVKDVTLPVLEYLKAVKGAVGPVASCTESTKLGDVVNELLKKRIHRSWVVDSKGAPTSVVSMSDVISKFSRFDVHVSEES